jgi:DNA gyrase subunit B
MTDADVDGAHIRTLLLTFFHRQMPEIIRAGHLFIAQPPLYKVAKGRSEVYLKDQPALDRYLVEAGLQGRVLETSGGARGGAELADIVARALRFKNTLAFVPRKYEPQVIEAMALKGALAPALSPADRMARMADAATHLQAGDADAVWTGVVLDDGSLRFDRTWRGVTDAHLVEAKFLDSAEARKVHTRAMEQGDIFITPVRLVRASNAPEPELEVLDEELVDEMEVPALTVSPDALMLPTHLVEAVMAAGRKGLAVSRYKGLGEMNAEQLWETTLDPENRALLQVKVGDDDITDDIFTRLMGDVVEPRREFIQDNALNVANLDI